MPGNSSDRVQLERTKPFLQAKALIYLMSDMSLTRAYSASACSGEHLDCPQV